MSWEGGLYVPGRLCVLLGLCVLGGGAAVCSVCPRMGVCVSWEGSCVSREAVCPVGAVCPGGAAVSCGGLYGGGVYTSIYFHFLTSIHFSIFVYNLLLYIIKTL